MVKNLIRELLDSGLTENDIVSGLKDAGVSTTQPTINRIKTGAISRVNYEMGAAIVAMHAKIRRKSKAA